MRAHDGRVEHLHQMGAPAQTCQSVEEGFEYPRSAQAPEALPDAVPVPELGGQRPPSDVVMGKIMQRLQELSIIPALVATTRARLQTPATPRPNPLRSYASAMSAPLQTDTL